jgi:predicted lipid-binding transport protein (Tim44 family)
MIFGATDSSARTNEAGEPVGDNGQPGAPGSNGMLLLLMVLGAGGLWWFMRSRRTPAPNFSGLSRSGLVSGSLLAESSQSRVGSAAVEEEITSADKATFQQSLSDIQTAWGKQDLAGLRRLVTPEMLEYFSTGLAEQASEGVANHVEDVVLRRADVRESWSEGATQYATVSLNWSARDYTVSLTKQRGEAGYLVEGNDEQPTEQTEVWTFMRFAGGKWLLSAIQQVA